VPYVERDAGDVGRPLLEKQRDGHRITSQGFMAEFPVVHRDGCFGTNGQKNNGSTAFNQ
jgi:hypothetical protein